MADEPNKKPQVVFRIRKDLLDKVDKEAEKISRTRTEVILRAIESYFERPAKPAK